MNRKTLKTIGIVAANLPVLLLLILLLSVISAIASATGQEPDTAPVYEYRSSFDKIDEALKYVDKSYAQGLSEPPNRFFLYAVYLTFFTQHEQDNDFYNELVTVGYTRETPHSKSYVAVTDEEELFTRLSNIYWSITDQEKQTIREYRELLAGMMAGKFLPPLFNQDFLQHIQTEFGGADNGITIAFDGIETLSARAIESGTVLAVDYDQQLGNYVLIQHAEGYQSLYAHLYEGTVKTGESVSAGRILGTISDSGMTTRPCLYLEIRLNGVPVNPRPLFESTTTEEVIP